MGILSVGRLGEARKHEVSFCADVKSWAEALFAQHPEWPFSEAHIEEYGRGTNKRQDLRILDREHQTPVLTGEAKMPGTPQGRSPYDVDLMRDAYAKADNIQSQYFFTWNVNTFVLFDRSLWDRPMLDRRVKEWSLGLQLTEARECSLPEVQARIRETFLPQFFAEFAEIIAGRIPDWAMPPDEVFIRSLESHLDWPVVGTRNFLAQKWTEDRGFAHRFRQWLTEDLQWSFDPDDPQNWRQILDRASRTLCYVFCNRAIFYSAIHARYPQDLRKLKMPSGRADCRRIYSYFRERFAAAVRVTGDYEPVFYPHVHDWVGSLVFASPQACQGWKGLLVNLEQYNFRDIPHDVIGGIFQKLIAPEERQKFGQYFTHEDIVDLINAFCIRRAGDMVLDPACGSGSFLVRAYHRKAWLSEQKGGGRRHRDPHKRHQELLQEIYGCDIALFPAHLATLNLAARGMEDQENYPLIRRGNFFEVIENPDKFCSVPLPGPGGQNKPWPVPLSPLDAIVGNPPYVRQELIPRRSTLAKARGESQETFDSRRKNTKEHFQGIAAKTWPGLKLSGRSDLHCYFWPVAAKRLKEGGYFGFLTSSSWLDVEYGFALQGWILQNFRLVAIIESVDEPWFEDARIKTCVTVLRRCSDERARSENLVKFVRLQKPLAHILGDRAPGDESARQNAAVKLRRLIESTKRPYHDENLRIIPVPQSDLWKEGVEAGKVLAKADTGNARRSHGEEGTGRKGAGRAGPAPKARPCDYAAGKWGRFVRAPEVYFRIMRDYGDRFVKLGEIAEIRRGITSGCDAFFMPRDVTERTLAEVRKGLPWNDIGLMSRCTRREVERGKVRVVQAGDRTLHPIEAEFLRPEVHSLMAVDRPVIRAADVDRVVLWVNRPLKELGRTHAARYIRWGAKQTFASNKSKAVPVPERSTCAARTLWYDLTGAGVGSLFWSMSQQYRHVVPANPDRLVCNHNLFYLQTRALRDTEAQVLCAVLNSTLIALFKTYYGRYAGTEGNLKTEVVDVNLLQVPSVQGVSDTLARKILGAFAAMQGRDTGRLVERPLMDCHSVEHLELLADRPIGLSDELKQDDRRVLDDAVLEMVGVGKSAERKRILAELYLETARHYRQIRIVEVQKQVQRAGGNERSLTAHDVAAAIWDSLNPDEQGPPLCAWLRGRPGDRETVTIPDGRAKALGRGHMFSPGGAIFTEGKVTHRETYAGPEQAALVETLANLEIRGPVELPADEGTSKQWRKDIQERLASAGVRFDDLAGSRTGSQTLRDGIVRLLMQWFVHGRA